MWKSHEQNVGKREGKAKWKVKEEREKKESFFSLPKNYNVALHRTGISSNLNEKQFDLKLQFRWLRTGLWMLNKQKLIGKEICFESWTNVYNKIKGELKN